MDLEKAKNEFVHAWGTLGSNWGINRTMAQMHALLLASSEPLSTEDIMEKLSISRGNTNMNIRELISWGLVQKEFKSGDRKEYFVAEKDMWEVSKCIIRERKKRELEPMQKVIQNLNKLEGDKENPEYKEFVQVIQDIEKLSNNAEKLLGQVIKAERNWFVKRILKLFA